MTRADLAKRIGVALSTLSDLENDYRETNRKSHLLAAALGLNPHYLDTDEGEPEAGAPQELPQEALSWPLPDVPHARLLKLNKFELKYAESKLIEALDEIEAERRKAKKAG